MFYWELETELIGGRLDCVPLYANRSTASDTIPPEEGWHCCQICYIACSNHTIVCGSILLGLNGRILDALITLGKILTKVMTRC